MYGETFYCSLLLFLFAFTAAGVVHILKKVDAYPKPANQLVKSAITFELIETSQVNSAYQNAFRGQE